MAKITRQYVNRENRSLVKYYQEIAKIELLSPEEEVELANKIKQGDQLAHEKLVKANLRFVVSVAKQYHNNGIHLGDLISEGNLGLMEAAWRFDETRGFKFISYAVWWIRHSILQALEDHSRIIKLPQNGIDACRKVGKAFSVLEQKFGREPNNGEVAEELDMSLSEVEETLIMSRRHCSIYAPSPFRQEDEDSLLDTIPDDKQPSTDHTLMVESVKIDIERALSTLTTTEENVIRLYFGIDLDQSLTLDEIGVMLELSRGRVSQIKERALVKLHGNEALNAAPGIANELSSVQHPGTASSGQEV